MPKKRSQKENSSTQLNDRKKTTIAPLKPSHSKANYATHIQEPVVGVTKSTKTRSCLGGPKGKDTVNRPPHQSLALSTFEPPSPTTSSSSGSFLTARSSISCTSHCLADEQAENEFGSIVEEDGPTKLSKRTSETSLHEAVECSSDFNSSISEESEWKPEDDETADESDRSFCVEIPKMPTRKKGRLMRSQTSQRGSVISADSSSRSEVAIKKQETDFEKDLVASHNTSLRLPRKAAVTRKLRTRTADVTEVDLAGQLNTLSIDDTATRQDDQLNSLLRLCGQDCPLDFSSFLQDHDFIAAAEASSSTSSFDVHKRTPTNGSKSSRKLHSNIFAKIGEASYSEVYSVRSVLSTDSDDTHQRKSGRVARRSRNTKSTSDSRKGANNLCTLTTESPASSGLALKVIPLLPSDAGLAETLDSVIDNEDEVSRSCIQDVQREIEITQLMSGLSQGFVKCYGSVPGALPV